MHPSLPINDDAFANDDEDEVDGEEYLIALFRSPIYQPSLLC